VGIRERVETHPEFQQGILQRRQRDNTGNGRASVRDSAGGACFEGTVGTTLDRNHKDKDHAGGKSALQKGRIKDAKDTIGIRFQ